MAVSFTYWSHKKKGGFKIFRYQPWDKDNFEELLDLEPHSSILVLGCGSSKLSDELTKRGHFVVSTDYSNVVCQKQKEIFQYEYTVADCGAAIHRKTFDLVIEKGVIDALVGMGFSCAKLFALLFTRKNLLFPVLERFFSYQCLE